MILLPIAISCSLLLHSHSISHLKYKAALQNRPQAARPTQHRPSTHAKVIIPSLNAVSPVVTCILPFLSLHSNFLPPLFPP